MKFSDNFKQYEDNLRLLLARLLVELQEDPEKLKEYTAKIKRRSSEKIYEGVDKIFSQLFFLESRIIFVRYGTLNDKPLTYDATSAIIGFKEDEVATYGEKTLQKLKDLGIKDSLERLINNVP